MSTHRNRRGGRRGRDLRGKGLPLPLTGLAESLVAERGSVTNIYLPEWFAHNLPAIHAPLIVLAGFLHGGNLRQRREPGPVVGLAVSPP